MAERESLIRLALFGRPVEHSLSPRIHAAFAAQAGLEVEYTAIDCGERQLAGELERLERGGGRGCNLTVPLKGRGAELAASLSERARGAGAVNTLILEAPGRWHGDNTDGPGLLHDLRARLGSSLTGRNVGILGAGGAAAGILLSLLQENPSRVTIANRTGARAQSLAERFRDAGPVTGGGLASLSRAGALDLLINATSLGHHGEAPSLAQARFAPGAACYDLNYGAAHRPLAETCRALGVPCFDGLGMLVAQAAASFALWTGFEPDAEPVIRALSRKP